jgi:superfamily II DNA/RNA helicase
MLHNKHKKCICYLTSVESAQLFYDILLWMKKLVGMQSISKKNTSCDEYLDLEYWQINHNTAKTFRDEIIKQFVKTKNMAIIVNVHILDEGIDIPECDSVFITQPSDNMTNIVQRICRSNRITNEKTTCGIYLWCTENKTSKVLDYIYDNTNGFAKDKIYVLKIDNKKEKEKDYKKINKLIAKQNKLLFNVIKYDGSNNEDAIIDDVNKNKIINDTDEINSNNKIKQYYKSKYNCDKCGRGYDNKTNYLKHINRKTPCNEEPIDLICDKCNTTFDYKCNYLRHINSKFSCVGIKEPINDDTIKNNMDEQTMKIKVKKFKCDTCNKWFTEKKALKTHQKEYCKLSIENRKNELTDIINGLKKEINKKDKIINKIKKK